MPSYDYSCGSSGKVFDVRHRINEKLHAWMQLCAYTGMELAD